MRVDIRLDETPPEPAVGRRRRWLPALGVLAAVLFAVAALHLRQPASGGSGGARDQQPPARAALVPGALDAFTIDTAAHRFTFTFAVTNLSSWPVTVTAIRLYLPDGLRATAIPLVVTSANQGRAPASSWLPLQLTVNSPVQVEVRLAVECDRLASVLGGPAMVLATTNVAGTTAIVDVAGSYEIFGWPWSAMLAADACGQQPGPPPVTPSGVRHGGHRR